MYENYSGNDFITQICKSKPFVKIAAISKISALRKMVHFKKISGLVNSDTLIKHSQHSNHCRLPFIVKLTNQILQFNHPRCSNPKYFKINSTFLSHSLSFSLSLNSISTWNNYKQPISDNLCHSLQEEKGC